MNKSRLTHDNNVRDHDLRASAQLKLTQAITLINSATHELSLSGWLLTADVDVVKRRLQTLNDQLGFNLRQIGLMVDKFNERN